MRSRIIFFLFSFILVTPTLNAQIKIEERVEIAPQQILSDDPQFPLELRISVYPSLLAPGDIREIGLSLCERRSFYGCYIIDFPQGQLFDAAITWDPFPGENDYNTPKLVSGTQISDTLLGVEEGFYFKAPEYLTVSYMVAVLEVKTYISGYGLIQDDYLVSMMLDTSLVISFNPANISPSDTSEIVIEKIRSDGVKIAYHPLQQFEVGIIEGCTAGKLLAAGDTASYFNRVTQPIYFVAADSIDEEEDTIKIRVGLNQELIDTYLPLKIKYEKQLAKQEKEERGEIKVTEEEKPVEQNPTDNPMISSCSFSTFESFLYEDVTKTLQDECDEEIVVCDNYQPPRFEDVGTITVLGENDPWQWIDDQGEPQTTNTGTACDFDIQGNRIDFGKTYILPKIGNYAPQPNPIYELCEDLKVTVCKDNSDAENPLWRYSAENIRVPVFSDHCPLLAQNHGYVDLGNGSNVALLSQNIKDCIDYKQVMETLDYWKKGPYHSYKTPPPYKFYFSSGIEEHENVHLKQLIHGGTPKYPIGAIYTTMDGLYLPFLANLKERYEAGSCPEDALLYTFPFQNEILYYENIVREKVIVSAIVSANELLTNSPINQTWLEKECEVEADELARWKYAEIKIAIMNWAKQQSWWCIPWPIVGDDYYRGCDGVEPCTP